MINWGRREKVSPLFSSLEAVRCLNFGLEFYQFSNLSTLVNAISKTGIRAKLSRAQTFCERIMRFCSNYNFLRNSNSFEQFALSLSILEACLPKPFMVVGNTRFSRRVCIRIVPQSLSRIRAAEFSRLLCILSYRYAKFSYVIANSPVGK